MHVIHWTNIKGKKPTNDRQNTTQENNDWARQKESH